LFKKKKVENPLFSRESRSLTFIVWVRPCFGFATEGFRWILPEKIFGWILLKLN